jgi:hypothetical protein
VIRAERARGFALHHKAMNLCALRALIPWPPQVLGRKAEPARLAGRRAGLRRSLAYDICGRSRR